MVKAYIYDFHKSNLTRIKCKIGIVDPNDRTESDKQLWGHLHRAGNSSDKFEQQFLPCGTTYVAKEY